MQSMQSTTEYGFAVRLNVQYDEAVRQVTAVLKEEGFGYVILGACNPPLAYRALQADLDVGLLLPCNVVVYEDGTDSVVSIIDPVAMLGVIENQALRPVADEARERLRRVVDALRRAS